MLLYSFDYIVKVMNTLSKRVAIKMKEQKITQSELANKVGVSQTTINRICSGQTKDPSSIFRLSEALKVSPFWLKFGDIREPKADYLQSVSWGEIPIFDLEKSTLTGHGITEKVLNINAFSRKNNNGLIWLRLEQSCKIEELNVTLPKASFVLLDLNKKEVTDKKLIAIYSYSEGITFRKLPCLTQSLFSFDLFLRKKVLGTVIEIRFYP